MSTLALQRDRNIPAFGIIDNTTGFSYSGIAGVCGHPWALTEKSFQEMQILGVDMLRMDFRWLDIEPSRDAPWTFDQYVNYDRFVAWGNQYGIEIMAILMCAPSWAPGGGDVSIPPNGPQFEDFVTQYGEFVYAVVDHYKDDITYFEIWNEPNVPQFWNDPDATRYHDFVHGEATKKYVTLLKEAYIQAKAANPNCVIISGGIGNDHVYLEEMYSYGVKGYFDIFGSHPYFTHNWVDGINDDVDYIDPAGHEYQFPKIQYMKDVMVANGEEDKKIMITEVGVGLMREGPEGWSTEEIQADRLTRVFEKTELEFPYVEGIMWYQFRDTHSQNWGLFQSDWTPRLMYYAYKEILQSRP